MSKPSMLTRNLRSELAKVGGGINGINTSTDSTAATKQQQATDVAKRQNDFNTALQDHVLKSGWLYRRNKRHSWKRRWFVLRDDQLTFYKDEREYKVEGIIPTIDIMSASVIASSGSGGGGSLPNDHYHQTDGPGGTHFAVFTSNHNLHFKADNSLDAQDWIEILRTVANQSVLSSSFKREQQQQQSLLGSGVPLSSSSKGQLSQSLKDLKPSPSTSTANFSGNIGGGILPPPEGVALPMSFNTFRDREQSIMASPSAFSGSLDAFSGTSSNHSEEYLSGAGSTTAVSGGAAPESHRSAGIVPNKDIPPLDLHEEMVIQVGYLLRLQRRLNKWVKQWVVLTSERVLFYKDDLQEQLYKVIPLRTISDVVDIDPLSKSKQYCMQIIAPEKRMRFCCESEEQLAQWLASFKLALDRSKR